MSFEFNSIEEIAADLAAGKPVVMLDNEERENEGDVICAAEFATTENVNFMAKWARGLICMPMDASYADKLNLPQMCITNTDNHCTAFSVSVDHVDTTPESQPRREATQPENLWMRMQSRMTSEGRDICSHFRQLQAES